MTDHLLAAAVAVLLVAVIIGLADRRRPVIGAQRRDRRLLRVRGQIANVKHELTLARNADDQDAADELRQELGLLHEHKTALEQATEMSLAPRVCMPAFTFRTTTTSAAAPRRRHRSTENSRGLARRITGAVAANRS